ncbi:glycoside hydrolase family 127 protein [Pseudoduganella namucuonensis]|uniref:Glycosyl hydrolase n=1 Tax=Pseudoduganella namucuonensis TaxID=1035707 RepID=A0A1I7M6Z6_9BURK|nr:glycoside hydrolase family 127 protein [Pseudoduganella namucuonensis]SFV17698.1 hypothetical protein SAMN05216552_10713 [Pseudoduganella namucuonensis]
MEFQKIPRTTAIAGDAWGRGLPADRDRRRLLRAMAAAPLLLGMPALEGKDFRYRENGRVTQGRDMSRQFPASPLAGEEGAEGETAQPFPLSAVRLLDGPFLRSQSLNARYLESLNCDRLLHNFRKNSGLAPKAPVYGGWEAEGLCPGHTLGHFLSACSMLWASTGREGMRARIDYVVGELLACQEAAPGSLVCGFPDGDTQLRNCLEGRPVVGVPWYTLHKLMAGLRDTFVHLRNAQALALLVRVADWVDEAARPVDEPRFQKMLDLEHGGMSEVLSDLHTLTGEVRYLRLAERFCHQKLLAPLAEGRDTLDGLHSNTQIPKVIGFARLHKLTGQAHYRQAARYFWRTVVEQRSFATGGHGDNEHFFPPAEVEKHLSSATTMETCCTYNMLRLTRALFAAQPSVAHADFYERALFNGILASQDPDSGMFTYFQATRRSYPKLYCTHEHSFFCCTGTGMENHAKHGDSIYFHQRDVLYVNLYMASDLRWADQGARLRQTTSFPERGGSRLTLRLERPTKLVLKLRHPGWCRQMSVRLNGRKLIDSDQAGRYVELARTWRDGDVLDVDLPMHVHLAPLPNAPQLAALMYGPLVLAARIAGPAMAPGADLVAGNVSYGKTFTETLEILPLRLGGAGLDGAVRRGTGALAFHLSGPDLGEGYELLPFHRIAHGYYNLYWRVG